MTDQHSEPANDETGIVPPQPKPEWPKKIRTLTAAELDRLTIDDEGRFYWDGHVVNYQPPEAPAEPESQPIDHDAMALLDRAARELSGQPPIDSRTDAIAPSVQAVEIHQPEPVSAMTTVATVPGSSAVGPMTIVDMARREPNEKVQVRLSFLQSLLLILIVVGVVIGAIGVAASGLVSALDWGCRINVVKGSCPPPPPAPRPPPRIDIPA